MKYLGYLIQALLSLYSIACQTLERLFLLIKQEQRLKNTPQINLPQKTSPENINEPVKTTAKSASMINSDDVERKETLNITQFGKIAELFKVDGTSAPVDVIFFGNVGSGKSTLISNVSGAPFESGASYGGGIIPDKVFRQDQKDRNIRWFDTAGLSDVNQASTAANTIQTALLEAADKKRVVKLVFVVELRSGRLDSNDIYLIKQVLDSIVLPDGETLLDNSYTVLINKMPTKLMKSDDFINGGRYQIESCFKRSESNSIKYSTSHIYYVAKDPKMEEETNAKFSDKKALNILEYILLLRAPVVTSVKSAKKINTDDYHEQMAKMALKFKQEMAERQKEWEEKSEKERKKYIDDCKARDDELNKSSKIWFSAGKGVAMGVGAGAGYYFYGPKGATVGFNTASWVADSIGSIFIK